MEQDLATLQLISETLKADPHASQRTLAKKTNMSLGMMNAILGRFVERGWIMLTNVNGRKLAYAVTAEGISELANRGRQFALRTFAIVKEYNDVLYDVLSKAKLNGKKKIILYGKSNIKFLLVYVCSMVGMEFEEFGLHTEIRDDSYCLIGELEEPNFSEKFVNKEYKNIMDVLVQ